MTSKSPVGDISVVTLIRTDTTLDHSQKAEKVCTTILSYPLSPHKAELASGLPSATKGVDGDTLGGEQHLLVVIGIG